MNEKFEETLRNSARFTTYQLAFTTLLKVIEVLTVRGAARDALYALMQGVTLLLDQLEGAANILANREAVDKLLNDLKGKNDKPR